MASFPEGLKKVFGVETPATPTPKLTPFVPAEWGSTNRRDSVRILHDEDAANYYNDGLSEAQREGIRIQAELLDRRQR